MLINLIILNSAVAGLLTGGSENGAPTEKSLSALEFSALTLTVPELRFFKYQNPLCFRVSAPCSSSLTAEFKLKF
jgi:hypothetical protein